MIIIDIKSKGHKNSKWRSFLEKRILIQNTNNLSCCNKVIIDCFIYSENLKTKNQRWKHTRHYWVYIDKGFPPCCLLLTKKFRGVPIAAEIWGVLLDYSIRFSLLGRKLKREVNTKFRSIGILEKRIFLTKKRFRYTCSVNSV